MKNRFFWIFISHTVYVFFYYRVVPLAPSGVFPHTAPRVGSYTLQSLIEFNLIEICICLSIYKSLILQGDQPICWQVASVFWVCGGGVLTRGGRGSGHRSYHPLINAAARRTLIIVPEFSSVFVDILIIITSHYVSAVAKSLMYCMRT